MPRRTLRALHSIIDTGRPFPLSRGKYLQLDADLIGLCRSCGHERATTDPDACGDLCPTCGQAEVYGVEELLTREEIRIL